MKANKINGLTGIRAIAAFWVLIYHSASVFYLAQPALNTFSDAMNPLVPAFANYGFLGVDTFFILSGFVISYTYFDWFSVDLSARKWVTHYARYIIFRLARIYPALMFVFFMGSLLLFLYALTPENLALRHLSLFFKSLPSMLTLTYNVSLTNLKEFSQSYWNFNPPLWSISIEWVAYLFFPFLVMLTSTFSKKYLLFIALFLLFILQLYVYISPPVIGNLVLSSVSFFIFGMPAIVRIAADFFLGYFFYHMYQDAKLSVNARYIDVAAIMAILAIVGMIYFFHVVEVLILIALGIFVFCVALNPPITGKLLSSRIMVYLGNISYAIYLVHFLVLQVIVSKMNQYHWFVDLNKSGVDKVFAFILYVLVVVVIASLVYHLIEKPAQRWIRKIPEKFI